MFSDFVALPKGTRLDGEVAWDNSATNQRNPSNPPVRVEWGDESRDEMGSVTLEMAPQRQEERAVLTNELEQRMRDTQNAACARDPKFEDRLHDMTTGNSPVFKAGEPKRP